MFEAMFKNFLHSILLYNCSLLYSKFMVDGIEANNNVDALKERNIY